MDVKKSVSNLKKKFKTTNIFELIDFLNIEIIETDLGIKTLGMYRTIKRNKFIFLNNNLDYIEKKFILAHELGHAVLHSSVNCFFLENNSFFVKNKIEREANEFSAELLIDDIELKDLLCSSYTTAQIAALMEVPESLILYKLKNLK